LLSTDRRTAHRAGDLRQIAAACAWNERIARTKLRGADLHRLTVALAPPGSIVNSPYRATLFSWLACASPLPNNGL